MKKRLLILSLLIVCQLAALLAPVRALWALWNNPDRAFEIAKGYDLLGNTVLNGNAKEYISTRAGRARTEGRRWGCVLCKILDAIEKDHCKKSQET